MLLKILLQSWDPTLEMILHVLDGTFKVIAHGRYVAALKSYLYPLCISFFFVSSRTIQTRSNIIIHDSGVERKKGVGEETKSTFWRVLQKAVPDGIMEFDKRSVRLPVLVSFVEDGEASGDHGLGGYGIGAEIAIVEHCD